MNNYVEPIFDVVQPKLIEVNEGDPLLFYQGKYRQVEEPEVIQKALFLLR